MLDHGLILFYRCHGRPVCSLASHSHRGRNCSQVRRPVEFVHTHGIFASALVVASLAKAKSGVDTQVSALLPNTSMRSKLEWRLRL
jgi:hypothetical protein